MRSAKALFATTALSLALACLLTGCSSTSSEDRSLESTESPAETLYLNAAYSDYKQVFDTWTWDDEAKNGTLTFGNAICNEMAKYPDNTREQNVMGEKAQVHLLDSPRRNKEYYELLVDEASDYLCPDESK